MLSASQRLFKILLGTSLPIVADFLRFIIRLSLPTEDEGRSIISCFSDCSYQVLCIADDYELSSAIYFTLFISDENTGYSSSCRVTAWSRRQRRAAPSKFSDWRQGAADYQRGETVAAGRPLRYFIIIKLSISFDGRLTGWLGCRLRRHKFQIDERAEYKSSSVQALFSFFHRY